MQRGPAESQVREPAIATPEEVAPSPTAQEPAVAAPPARIRIAAIDPYPIFRTGVVQAFARCPELVLVAEGATIEDAHRAAREAAPIHAGVPYVTSELASRLLT